MLTCFVEKVEGKTIPILPLTEKTIKSWLEQQDQRLKNYIAAINYTAKACSSALICDVDGNLERVLIGMADDNDFWVLGLLAATLPAGIYHLEGPWSKEQKYFAALAWGLGNYQFTTYKKMPALRAKLLIDNKEIDYPVLENVLASTYLVRDLINTPTEDMGPAELADAAEKIAAEFGAEVKQIIGDDLLVANYPAIHIVGRASDHAPRLVDLRWGNPAHPKVTLVGKGVCFDTGGLDLKPPSGMALMKKDMAGAAHVLGLARAIMNLNIPVRLRVLIPAVENAVSGDAYHPGDIFVTRKGISVEVSNTDAEGRLVLCDALAEAVSEQPELLLDFATLTGAARIALGTDIAALFSMNDQLANDLIAAGTKVKEVLWRLPIYLPYRKLLESPVADILNAANSPFGGAITAAVFLREFVPDTIAWAHFDIMAWNVKAGPGRPEGGEAMALRAVLYYLLKKYT